MKTPHRVLVAKPGLDGHDRGAKVLVSALRDAGMEVIYTGLHQTPEMIAISAIQEDVDLICVSILSGAHKQIFESLMALLKEKQAGNITVLAGGIIPDSDVKQLKTLGVTEIFEPNVSIKKIIDTIEKLFPARA